MAVGVIVIDHLHDDILSLVLPLKAYRPCPQNRLPLAIILSGRLVGHRFVHGVVVVYDIGTQPNNEVENCDQCCPAISSQCLKNILRFYFVIMSWRGQHRETTETDSDDRELVCKTHHTGFEILIAILRDHLAGKCSFVRPRDH